jgi:hypothetical protein
MGLNLYLIFSPAKLVGYRRRITHRMVNREFRNSFLDSFEFRISAIVLGQLLLESGRTPPQPKRYISPLSILSSNEGKVDIAGEKLVSIVVSEFRRVLLIPKIISNGVALFQRFDATR